MRKAKHRTTRWQAIVLGIVLGCGLSALASAETTIHVFTVFCDAYPGEAGAINEGVTADQVIVNGLFDTYVVEDAWKARLRRKEFRGEAATKPNVIQGWNDFSAGISSGDVVYVHFSGHGVIPDRQSGEQFLQTCDLEFFSRNDWATSIESVPARLKILVTDCCSSYVEVIVAEGDGPVDPWNNLYYLLMKHEGFVNITAASPGQPAYGTNVGGFLTVNLDADIQRFRTWREVFEATQARVFTETEAEIRSIGDPDLLPQRPFAYTLGDPLFDPASDKPVVPDEVEFILPDSGVRELTRGDVERLNLQQLYLARNEIFARHGFDFGSGVLREHFASRSWYLREPGLKSPPLSTTEKRNLALIQEVENEFGGPFTTQPDASTESLTGNTGDSMTRDTGYADLFPNSSFEKLSRSMVQALSLPELSIARNEIFARHGYPFRSAALRAYFARKPGYTPNPAATSPNLNAIESYNIWLLEKIERIKGGPHRW